MTTVRAKMQQILFSMTLSQIISGLLGALIMLLLVHVTEPQPKPLGTVNVSGIINTFVKAQASQNLPQAALKQRVTAFGKKLQLALDQVAQQHHVTLMMQEAVVAGAKDYTAEVKALIPGSGA